MAACEMCKELFITGRRINGCVLSVSHATLNIRSRRKGILSQRNAIKLLALTVASRKVKYKNSDAENKYKKKKPK